MFTADFIERHRGQRVVFQECPYSRSIPRPLATKFGVRLNRRDTEFLEGRHGFLFADTDHSAGQVATVGRFYFSGNAGVALFGAFTNSSAAKKKFIPVNPAPLEYRHFSFAPFAFWLFPSAAGVRVAATISIWLRAWRARHRDRNRTSVRASWLATAKSFTAYCDTRKEIA